MTRIKAWHGFAGIRLRILLGLMLCALRCDAGDAFAEVLHGSFEVFSYNNRSHFRVNTAAGFHDITEGRRYFFLSHKR